MDRLLQISLLNPEWAVNISEFITTYPEFRPYLYMAPMSPIIKLPHTEIKTLFDCFIWYVSQSGVKYSYAEKQLLIIFPLIKHPNWNTVHSNLISLQTNINIQPKKRQVYFNIANYMMIHNMTHNTFTIDNIIDISQQKIGVGDSCVGFCKGIYTNDDDGVECTDMYFMRAYNKIYGTDNRTHIKYKVDKWKLEGFGKIANMMMFQIHHYS